MKSTRKVNYARIDARELPSLLRWMEVYPGTHVTRMALKLMALTFVRTSELIGAKWAEFDIDSTRWNIPAERMKMRTPHIVPLSKQAVEVLEILRTLTGTSKWLFPGDRIRAHLGLRKDLYDRLEYQCLSTKKPYSAACRLNIARRGTPHSMADR